MSTAPKEKIILAKEAKEAKETKEMQREEREKETKWQRIQTSELSFLSIVIKGSNEDNNNDGHQNSSPFYPTRLTLVFMYSSSACGLTQSQSH